METIIKLKSAELNARLLSKIKKYAGNDRGMEIQIKISRSARKTSLTTKETKGQTKHRIDSAIDDLEKGKNVVSFSGDEFETLTDLLFKKAS
jgi:hypothetical protein